MHRRQFIMGLSAAGLTACATGPALPPAPIVPPVNVSRDRILQTVVGLRPFRSGGFRLGVEPFGGKAMVHNYGHGGDGVSLSWGSSQIAAEHAYRTGAQDVAVIGCGVMGLTTALLLSSWGRAVTIYAAELPPYTTSNIAGAHIWVPSNFRRRQPNSETLAQDARVIEISKKGFASYVGKGGYGVKRVNHYLLGREGEPRNSKFLGRPVRQNRTATLVDPGLYLEALVRDVGLAGAVIEKRRFMAATELINLPQQTVVNCAGLGAGDLFHDPDVTPDRGQLTLLKPQAEIDYSYIARRNGDSLYMFPRETAIVLGGTHDRGNGSLIVDRSTEARMLKDHGALAANANRTDAFV